MVFSEIFGQKTIDVWKVVRARAHTDTNMIEIKPMIQDNNH